MKHVMLSIAALCLSVSAYAMPSVGDDAVYSTVVTTAGKNRQRNDGAAPDLLRRIE